MKKRLALFSLVLTVFLFVGAGCVSLTGGESQSSGPAGIFVSSDSGNTWQVASTLMTSEGLKSIAGVNVYRLFHDPQDSQAMYLGTRENGMFYTYNGGKSWQQSSGALAQGFVYSVAVHPQDKCTIVATNGRQIFKSSDCNRTWSEVYRESRSNITINSLAYTSASPYKLFMAEINGDILQTMDGGISWSVLKRFGKRLSTIETDKFDNNVVYVTSREDGLYRSDNGGLSWSNLKNNMKNYSGSTKYRRFIMSESTPGKIYWISTYGILYSLDRGDTWTALNLITPPGSASIYGFAVNPQNENEISYTATISGRSTFYKSIDNGENWVTKKLPSGQIPVFMWVHPEQASLLYLGFTAPLETSGSSNSVYFGN